MIKFVVIIKYDCLFNFVIFLFLSMIETDPKIQINSN